LAYDPAGRACTLSTEGASGPDRISRTTYDSVNRVVSAISALGTSAQQVSAAQSYTANGQAATLADASGNLTTTEYDGFDRVRKIRFPNASGGGSSTTDYEQYSYDAGSNLTQDRRRDGALVNFAYDNLSRVILMDAPAPASDVVTAYDNFSRAISVATAGVHTLSFAYDQLSRNTSATRVANGATQVLSYQYDLAGRRTRVTWPDGFYAGYDVDVSGAVTAIRENGAASGIGVLAAYAYDNYGRRTSVSRGNGLLFPEWNRFRFYHYREVGWSVRRLPAWMSLRAIHLRRGFQRDLGSPPRWGGGEFCLGWCWGRNRTDPLTSCN
jgi:YD repeat-containing protein